MSMVCFELSRELHEQEKVVRGIQIADADSLCNYLKGFWEFIYNHKMFGCVYDIYSDDIEVRRENGFVLRGIPAVEHAVMRLCSAFPDLKAEVATIFASSQGENRYQVWMRYYFSGTNTGPSIYGPPTGLKLEKEKALNISSFHVEKIDGEWLIAHETTGLCCDYIRAVCTGDKRFSCLEI